MVTIEQASTVMWKFEFNNVCTDVRMNEFVIPEKFIFRTCHFGIEEFLL